MPAPASVVVVGSINIDYTATLDSLPTTGATVHAKKLTRGWGGKGANQAVAASRQGARVALMGCVGAGDGGIDYLLALEREAIDVQSVKVLSDTSTSSAWITVDEHGENSIVVLPGANESLMPSLIESNARYFQPDSILLVQWEVPRPAVLSALNHAKRSGMRAVMNPSPFSKGFVWEEPIDTLILNEGEAEALFGFNGAGEMVVDDVRKRLTQLHVNRLVVTRGRLSTLCVSPNRAFGVATIPVTPQDTVGAGDAFAGTFAARLAESADLESVVHAANCAGALATLIPGAQASMPDRASTDRLAALHPISVSALG